MALNDQPVRGVHTKEGGQPEAALPATGTKWLLALLHDSEPHEGQRTYRH